MGIRKVEQMVQRPVHKKSLALSSVPDLKHLDDVGVSASDPVAGNLQLSDGRSFCENLDSIITHDATEH